MTQHAQRQSADYGYRESAMDDMTLDVEAILASSHLVQTFGSEVDASFLTGSDIDFILATCSGRTFDNF